MIDHEEEGEEVVDVEALPQLQSHAVPALACTDFTNDAEFRTKHPLALRALCGGIALPAGVRPYALVAVENPLKRRWVYEHGSGIPADAFPGGGPCRYKPEHLRIRFTWEPGETKLVPQPILQGLWQIRDGAIVGGSGTELRLARGQRMPQLSADALRVRDEEARSERERTGRKVRS